MLQIVATTFTKTRGIYSANLPHQTMAHWSMHSYQASGWWRTLDVGHRTNPVKTRKNPTRKTHVVKKIRNNWVELCQGQTQGSVACWSWANIDSWIPDSRHYWRRPCEMWTALCYDFSLCTIITCWGMLAFPPWLPIWRIHMKSYDIIYFSTFIIPLFLCQKLHMEHWPILVSQLLKLKVIFASFVTYSANPLIGLAKP